MIYQKFGRFYDAVMGDRAESAAFIHRLVQKQLLEKFEVVKIIDPIRRRPCNRSEKLYFLCRR